MGFISDIATDFKRARLTRQLGQEEREVSSLAVNESKGYRLPCIYANDDILLTDKAAWMGTIVQQKPWGYLSRENIESYYRSAEQFYKTMFPSSKGNQGQILITNRVYSPSEWENALIGKFADSASDQFAGYVKGASEVINQTEFFDRETYLFVRMGDRDETTGVRGFIRRQMEALILGATGVEDKQPSDDEVAKWVDNSDVLATTLAQSWVRATPINRRRVEWLTRHLDTPSLPTPETTDFADGIAWGAGEWRTVLASYTEQVSLGKDEKNRYTAVKFTAPYGEGTSYAAFLPIATIPAKVAYDANWVHHASSLDFPVDLSLRFEIIGGERAVKTVERPLQDAQAQADEDSEANISDDVVAIQAESLREVKTKVKMGRDPIVRWQGVFCVHDTDPIRLKTKITKLIRHYKDMQFELVCPSKDQRELFYQSFPGGEIEIEDWIHRGDTRYLAAAGPWYSTSVGDNNEGEKVGLYQGFTIVRDRNGIAQQGGPVFYDLLNVVDVDGTAPTEAVAAESGSGKTVSRGLKAAYEDALRGFTQMIWDPKGDFISLFVHHEWLRLDPKKLKLIDLRDAESSVSLDPFGVAEVETSAVHKTGKPIDNRASLGRTTLFQMLQIDKSVPDFETKSYIIRAAVANELHKAPTIADVARLQEKIEAGEPVSLSEEPCLQGVIQQFIEWSKTGVVATKSQNLEDGDFDYTEGEKRNIMRYCRNFAQTLRDFSDDSFGALLFNRPSKGALQINKGDLVLFVAINLKTTEPDAEPTDETIIPDIISGMMADFIRSMLYRLPDNYIKSATFDEWHVIRRSGRADELVKWLRRMGRSKRCMVRQMSQSARDFYDANDAKSSRTSLSVIWCGKVNSDDEASASCVLLGMEDNDYNRSTLRNLGKGQFLMKDIAGKIGFVQVSFIDPEMLDKFNTDAKTKQLFAEGSLTIDKVK